MQSKSDAHQRNKRAGLDRYFHTGSVVLTALLARIQQDAVQCLAWLQSAESHAYQKELHMSYAPAWVPVNVQYRVSTQRALYVRAVKV